MDLLGATPAPSGAPAAEAVRATSPGTTTTVDVLLVGDEDGLRALRELLADVPARLIDARAGEEALHCLLQQDFALVLMAMQLPGLSGLETAEVIRQRDRSRLTPILLLSPCERTDERLVEACRLGIVDFVVRPVAQHDVLKGLVGWFVDLHRTKALLEREPDGVRAAELREHERTQLLAELRRRAAGLAESDRRTDELLAMLAHELRNPLAPVLHAVELLREGHADAPACRRALDAASRQVRHMVRLVDDLVDVSRIRTGKVALQRGPVALAEVVKSAVQALEPLLLERRHALAVVLPEEPVWLDADAVRLAQAIENLLHNAAKYTDEGGHVRLLAERTGDELVLRVRDDRMGIPAAVLPRVFDVFVQGEQPPDRSRGGLGLGLALVKSIVELHGGWVQARSDGPGHGTEVTVRLPAIAVSATRAGADAAAAASPALHDGHAAQPRRPVTPMFPPPSPAPRSLRIAIAEDNPDVRETLGLLLAARGHVVLQAEDGLRAVELVLAEQPDVALLDIGLPGLDGYEVAARVRASAPATRLVAVTGYGRAEDRQRALDAGFHAHLVKPVDLAELTRLLERL